MQCTPDLSEQVCSDCLEAAVNRIPNTNLYGKVGGRILQSTCNFRYEIYEFFNQTTQSISPPSRSIPQSPPGYVLYLFYLLLLVISLFVTKLGDFEDDIALDIGSCFKAMIMFNNR
ncbi:putative Gnk2-like domain-containing protein [Helianthus annuus]|nr:putative Gnk2-like domain-containing protein [Helianthus annuus]